MSSVPRNLRAPSAVRSPRLGGLRVAPVRRRLWSPWSPGPATKRESHVRRRTPAVSLLLAALLLVAACGSGGGSATGPAAPAGPPQRGGEITVLEDAAFAGGWP